MNFFFIIVGLILGRVGYIGFYLVRKKDIEFILNRKEKRYLMKVREISCLNFLIKKR